MTRRPLQSALGLTLLAAAALTAAPVPERKFDWPQWRGPNHNDVSKETGLLKAWPADGPKLLWTFRDAGAGYSGPSIVGDRLYTMGAMDGKEYIFAIDLKTQKKVWSTPIGKLYENGWGDGPRGNPTVDGDLVFGIGGQGNLICVKADTGEQVWISEFRKDLGGDMMSGWGYCESPLVDGDKVVATPGGKNGALAAFNKKTGEVLWRSKEFTDKAAYSSLVPCEIAGVRQYVVMTGDSVAGIAAADGKLLWSHARKGPTAAIPTPVVAGDLVYTTSGYGAGCHCFKITAADGKFTAEQIYANKNMTDHHGGVLLVGDYIYGHSDNGGWTCMDLKTGEVVKAGKGRWGEDSKLGKGCLTCADGHLYCFSESKGECVLVEASPKGWIETGRFTIPEKTKLPRKAGQIWTHPVVSNGKLYLRDQDLIFCYDIQAK